MSQDVIDGFQLTSVSQPIRTVAINPLGPLAQLAGTWKGTGFNQIWRPFHDTSNPAQDRFLELNETTETLVFDPIPGEIPNRGLLQPDINLAGIRYLQQIQDTHVKGPNGKPAGIHIEPGIWINVPSTTDPNDPTTVARMANIPHGTSIVVQGASAVLNGPPPQPFQAVDITPFVINNPANRVPFPESNLAIASAFRTAPTDIPGVTQAMVSNPNIVLAAGLTGKTIVSTTVLKISTVPLDPPTTGGGTSNIAFLQGPVATPPTPNAQAAQVDATFWIETVKHPNGHTSLQLQYSQIVLLNFKGLSWPHVSVATLEKQ
jgi:hypothetical protein